MINKISWRYYYRKVNIAMFTYVHVQYERSAILDLHVGGEVQKNILSIVVGTSLVGGRHCLVIPERLVASQEFKLLSPVCV